MLAMTGLSGADYAALMGLVGVPVGVIMAYLRMMRSDNRTFLEEFRARFAALEGRVLKIEGEKVNQKDWATHVVRQLNRQDRMNAQLAELGGKLDATIGLAGGLKRIGDTLERTVEVTHGR